MEHNESALCAKFSIAQTIEDAVLQELAWRSLEINEK